MSCYVDRSCSYHVIHDISVSNSYVDWKWNINYIQLPIKDDDDVRLMFHVVAQILPSNTIEMYLQTRPMDHSSGLSPSLDQKIIGHDVEIPT